MSSSLEKTPHRKGESDSRNSEGRFPDFVIIGAMKSGTTSLYRYLSRDSRLYMSKPKEPRFFSQRYDRAGALDWYRSLFSNARENQLTGEASTCYTRWPRFGGVAERMARMIPDARLIYIIRHPVDRVYSHYIHLMQHRMETQSSASLSLEEALEDIPELVDTSLYMKQIEQYLSHFSRDQILLLVLDDLVTNPAGALAETQRFLGLEPNDVVWRTSLSANRAGTLRARIYIGKALDTARAQPLLSTLSKVVPRGLRRRIDHWARTSLAVQRWVRGLMNLAEHEFDPMKDEVREDLLDRFSKPTRELEHFLGRELPMWFI